MVATFFILLAAATAQPQPQKLPPLDRRESKKVLHEGEKQLAAYRLSRLNAESSRPEPNKAARRSKSSSMVEHRGNPLTGRICEFPCRFEITALARDMIRKKRGSSEFAFTPPVHPEHGDRSDRYVIVATINAAMGGLYKFGDYYPGLLEALDRELKEAKANSQRARRTHHSASSKPWK